MGSGSVMHLVNQFDLCVAYDGSTGPGGYGHWWAVGIEGSYGGSTRRSIAVSIAADASATVAQGRRRIRVHDVHGRLAYTITRVKCEPSSQFFQDDVP